MALSRSREEVSPLSADETVFFFEEAISSERRRRPETIARNDSGIGQQRGSIISAILTLIYRTYCVTCLTAMRRLNLAG